MYLAWGVDVGSGARGGTGSRSGFNFYPHVQMEIVMICSVAWRALPFDSFSVLVLVCGFIQPPTVCNLNMFRTL